jgi:hypothetical protein
LIKRSFNTKSKLPKVPFIFSRLCIKKFFTIFGAYKTAHPLDSGFDSLITALIHLFYLSGWHSKWIPGIKKSQGGNNFLA